MSSTVTVTDLQSHRVLAHGVPSTTVTAPWVSDTLSWASDILTPVILTINVMQIHNLDERHIKALLWYPHMCSCFSLFEPCWPPAEQDQGKLTSSRAETDQAWHWSVSRCWPWVLRLVNVLGSRYLFQFRRTDLFPNECLPPVFFQRNFICGCNEAEMKPESI